MTKAEFKINRFCAPDKQEVLDLLSGAELPTEDLSDEKMQNFMVARSEDNSIIGVVGIEMFQDNGLVRSLAVQPAYREKGLGSRLTREIESFAYSSGIKTLYLLTMTASDFFSKFDYQVIRRDQAPESIQNTAEFNNLCPVSAACLCKTLDGA